MVVVALAMLGSGCGGGSSGDDVDARPHPDGPPGADASPDAPFNGTPVTFTVLTYDGQPENGDVVLYSDNDGPWHPVTGTNGVYHFSVAGPRYAIARGCDDPASQYTEAWLYYLTLGDSTDVHDVGCHSSGAGVTVSGALTGLTGHRGLIQTQSGFTLLTAAQTDYSLVASPGTTDLVTKLYPNVPATQPRPTERLLVERDLVIPTTDLVHDLDFTADGVAPETHTFTISGGQPGATSRVGALLDTGKQFGYSLESTSVTTDDYHTLPAALMQTGDKLVVTRSSDDAAGFRSVALTIDAPADLTGTLPDAYPAGDPTIAGTGPLQLAGTLPLVAGGDVYTVDATVIDDATFDFWFWSQSYTAAYAAGQDIDYSFPNLIGIGGWTIELGAGEVDWDQFVRSSSTSDLGVGYVPTPAVGDITTETGTAGFLTPP